LISRWVADPERTALPPGGNISIIRGNVKQDNAAGARLVME
jgi:hypothetical protein